MKTNRLYSESSYGKKPFTSIATIGFNVEHISKAGPTDYELIVALRDRLAELIHENSILLKNGKTMNAMLNAVGGDISDTQENE